MTRVDLDAVRRARAEATKAEPPVVVFGGRDHTLPAVLPASVLVAVGRMQTGDLSGLRDALDVLFGDAVDEVLRGGFDVEDLAAVLAEAYGQDGRPEASASAP